MLSSGYVLISDLKSILLTLCSIVKWGGCVDYESDLKQWLGVLFKELKYYFFVNLLRCNEPHCSKLEGIHYQTPPLPARPGGGTPQ